MKCFTFLLGFACFFLKNHELMQFVTLASEPGYLLQTALARGREERKTGEQRAAERAGGGET